MTYDQPQCGSNQNNCTGGQCTQYATVTCHNSHKFDACQSIPVAEAQIISTVGETPFSMTSGQAPPSTTPNYHYNSVNYHGGNSVYVGGENYANSSSYVNQQSNTPAHLQLQPNAGINQYHQPLGYHFDGQSPVLPSECLPQQHPPSYQGNYAYSSVPPPVVQGVELPSYGSSNDHINVYTNNHTTTGTGEYWEGGGSGKPNVHNGNNKKNEWDDCMNSCALTCCFAEFFALGSCLGYLLGQSE